MAPGGLTVALLLVAGLALPAFAETSPDKEARLREAIAACHKGASVPLDPDANRPAVHFSEFYFADSTFEKSLELVQTLANQCKIAAAGAPADKRLKLERMRVSLVLAVMTRNRGGDDALAAVRRDAGEV